jgi:DMSO/TMAO reductase YedYZ molybdopterin-dependent catalytic subunit
VALYAILERAGVRPTSNYLTLHADRDDFHVSVPLDAIRNQGIVVYRQGRERLGLEQGGPIRLLIQDPSSCHTGELDDCANVKYLSRIELTERRGRDTRPTDDAAHAALHEAQAKSSHGDSG